MPRSEGRRAAAQPLSVGAISLGCPKNLVDTEVMLGLLRQAGFAIVPEARRADVLLVNTCCFIAPAREEAAEALAEAAALRREGVVAALVCAGCWPQRDARELRARFPEIDALAGPGDVPRIVEIVAGALQGTGPAAPTASPSAYLYDHATPRLRATPPWTAYLKIAEGCGHRCRFCLIPRLRGRYRSRPLTSVVAEARALAAAGVKELNLVAQDTTAYGRDLGGPDLADLLEALSEVKGLRWVRALYGFPTRVTPRLIEPLATRAIVCQYLDLPFQHADREVLARMGRPGDGERYLALIARLRSAMPDIALRSTVLVGFPGEDEAAFARLLAFLEAAQLDHVGAFRYSREPGTPAADMPDQVPAEVAEERYHAVMARQQQISLLRNRRWVGRELKVLVEAEGTAPGEWLGRSFRHAPEIDGGVVLRAPGRRLRPGQFVIAQVVSALPYDLVAIVGPASSRRDRGRRR